MELSQLRYFMEVAKSQHITASAEKLHIAQPALSRSVHKLEEGLGVPLFLHRGRNVVLSRYGAFLQEKLAPILQELEELPGDMAKMAHRESKTVRLNVLAASTLVTEMMIAYNKTHDYLQFECTQNSKSNDHDIGITTKLTYEAQEENPGEFVLTERIYLAVPANHPLAQQEEITLKEAAEEGFISLMGSRQFRWICDRFCHVAGFEPHNIFESDSPAAVRNMIAAQMGVAFWPEFSWGKLDTEDVRLLKLREPDCYRDILFQCAYNKADNDAVADFFDFIKKYCGRMGETF